VGGAELYLLDVASHYRDTSKVLLFEEGPFQQRLADAGVDVDVLPTSALSAVQKNSGLLDAISAIPELLQLSMRIGHHARQHDALYANSQKALVACSLAAWWSQTPLLWNLHDLLTADHFSAMNRQVAVRCANWFVDRVIANSEATEAAFRDSGGRVPTQVVYNGLDAARFSPPRTSAELRALRSELGLPDDAPLVGTFSRLAAWKGQHILLEALAALPDVHALLVGDALFESDASYAQRLRRLAARHGIEARVHFLGFRDDIPALMQLVDIVAHTSTAPEPFGRVIVEGMLAGTPVVAMRAGGAVEIIESGKTGLLVEPGSPEALRRAIHTLLTDPSLAQAMTCVAHHYATQQFSISQMIDGVDDAIRSALS